MLLPPALEAACIERFGTLRPEVGPTLRRGDPDNGLIFQSRWFRAACRDYCLHQEFITLIPQSRTWIVKRFFRSLERGLRLAAQLPELRGGALRRAAMDRMVQRRSAAGALSYLSLRQYRAH